MPSYLLDISINAKDGATGPVQKAESSFSSLAKTVGKTLAVGFAAASAAAVGFGIKAVQMASDAEETKSKFNTVFKDMAGEVGTWSDSVANSMGLTKSEAKGMLASVQDLLVPFGMARDEAGRMSKQVLELAGDMASFNNLNAADVVRDINSALVGSSEPMMKYGVVLNVASVEAKALAMGLIGAEEEMTQSAKAAATMALIMEATSDAQGDLGRTQDSFANQMRSAQASVKDFTTEIGARLLPVVTPLLSKFTEWASLRLPEWVDALDQKITDARVTMFVYRLAWDNDWRGIRSTIEGARDAVTTAFGEMITDLRVTMFVYRLAWDNDWRGVRTTVETAVTDLKAIVNGIAPAIEQARIGYNTTMFVWKLAWDNDLHGMQTKTTAFRTNTTKEFGLMWKELRDIVTKEELSNALGYETDRAENDWQAFTSDMLTVGGNLFRNLEGVFSGGLRTQRGLLQLWSGLMDSDWKSAWGGLLLTSQGVLNATLSAVNLWGPDLKGGFYTWLHDVDAMFVTWGQGLSSWWTSFWSSFSLPSWLGGGGFTPPVVPPIPPPIDPGQPSRPSSGGSGSGGFGNEGNSVVIQNQNFYGMESAGSLKRAAEMGVLSGARAIGIA